MAAIKADVKVGVEPEVKSDKNSDVEMDKKPDSKSTAELPFTIKIINLDGTSYYELESEALGQEKAVTDEYMKDLIAAQIDLAHVPKNHPHFLLCGTFFVNLSVFKK